MDRPRDALPPDPPLPRPSPDRPAATNRAVVDADLPAILALHGRVFGPGRFARAAYRVREGTPPISPYCRAAFGADGTLLAALRMTPVTIGCVGRHLLLGPLAVVPEVQGQGYGKALVADAVDDATADGIGLVVLVGDMPYYGRFGFVPVPPGRILMPGPANPARILARETTPDALATAHGMVAAARW